MPQKLALDESGCDLRLEVPMYEGQGGGGAPGVDRKGTFAGDEFRVSEAASARETG